MAEEFLESEVVFSDNHYPPRDADGIQDCRELVASLQKQNSRSGGSSVRSGETETKKTAASSVPVNIPQVTLRSWDSGEEETGDEEEMVPPHEILRRRITGKMAFSVFTGHGRTLKGRDLRLVRNSILRLTGFLEV